MIPKAKEFSAPLVSIIPRLPFNLTYRSLLALGQVLLQFLGWEIRRIEEILSIFPHSQNKQIYYVNSPLSQVVDVQWDTEMSFEQPQAMIILFPPFAFKL